MEGVDEGEGGMAHQAEGEGKIQGEGEDSELNRVSCPVGNVGVACSDVCVVGAWV